MRAILVFGLFAEDSGKTVAASALCRGLKNKGWRVAPFKPRSGHNLWYQYDAYEACKQEGRLYCEDIIKLKEASDCNLPYELLNPVDALLAPIEARGFLKERREREMYILEENSYTHLLVERYTHWDGGLRLRVLVNQRWSANRLLRDEGHLEELIEGAEEVISVTSLDEWSEAYRRMAPRCISSCMDRVSKSCDIMIVEGYNDAACPTSDTQYDAVIGVAPGVAVFYNPQDYFRVLEAYRGLGRDPMELRAREMIPFLKPEGFVNIPPIRREELENYDILSERLSSLVDAAFRNVELDL